MASVRWRVTRAMGPLLERIPPYFQIRLYHRISGDPFVQRAFDDSVVRRVAPHGYRMKLDLRDWMDRYVAINGRYYEAETTALLQRLLKPGMLFVDIGGNIGFVSLTAARLVGTEGRVVYVEPNSPLAERFQETLEENGIRNVEVHQVALAESSGEVGLEFADGHGLTRVIDGTGTIAVTGDELLSGFSSVTPMLIKIDVEGYEERVLAGMRHTIARTNTAFYIEVTDDWLRRQGGSAAGLFETMIGGGYRGWLSKDTPTGLSLLEIDHVGDVGQCNILFARAGDFGAPFTD